MHHCCTEAREPGLPHLQCNRDKLYYMDPPVVHFPENECEEKCAKLRAELEEMKREKNEEVRSLRDELQKMEERKDHYKNNFSQAEDRANDEEQGIPSRS